MKHFFSGLTLGLILFAGINGVYAQDNSPKKETSLRLMSYNIRNAMGMDDVTDLDRLSGVISRLNPDVVALQEIDSVTRRSAGKDVLQEIAQRVGMEAVYAPAISFDGGKYGVGILSKEKPLNYKIIPLPGREEARTLLIAEYQRYIFACTHLSLTEEDRAASLTLIIEQAKEAGKPFILAGDLNAEPDSPFMLAFNEKFDILSDVTQPTFPADHPTVCIDYLGLFKKSPVSFQVLNCSVPDAPVESDHRPVVAEIEWLNN